MADDLTVAKCLDLAIKSEDLGAELYARLARKFGQDRELSELFEGLGRDEIQHRELFRSMRDRAVSSSQGRILSNDQKNYLRAMSFADLVSSTESLEKDVEAIKSRDDALERVLRMEKATLAYYQAMRDVLGKDETVESLITVEKSHVVKVMQLMITGAKFRGLADSF